MLKTHPTWMDMMQMPTNNPNGRPCEVIAWTSLHWPRLKPLVNEFAVISADFWTKP